MNIHAVKSEDLLVLFLHARWLSYDIERETPTSIRFRPSGNTYWDRLEETSYDGDYRYYTRLAIQWDADGRGNNATDYW